VDAAFLMRWKFRSHRQWVNKVIERCKI